MVGRRAPLALPRPLGEVPIRVIEVGVVTLVANRSYSLFHSNHPNRHSINYGPADRLIFFWSRTMKLSRASLRRLSRGLVFSSLWAGCALPVSEGKAAWFLAWSVGAPRQRLKSTFNFKGRPSTGRTPMRSPLIVTRHKE